MSVRYGDERVLYDNGEGGVGVMIPFWGFTGQDLVDRIREAGRSTPGADFIGNKEFRIIRDFQMPDQFFLYACDLVDFKTHKSHVRINMDRAKKLAHKWRVHSRAIEMQPYDRTISAQIPGQVEKAEAERVKLRAKYAEIQEQIDNAKTPDELKAIMQALPKPKPINATQRAA